MQVQAIVDHHRNVDVKVATKVRFQEPGSQNANLTDEALEKLVQENEGAKETEAGGSNQAAGDADGNEEQTQLIGGSPKQDNKENTENEAKENEEKKDSPESKKPTITP